MEGIVSHFSTGALVPYKNLSYPFARVLKAFHAENANNFLARTPKQCDKSSLLTHSTKRSLHP